MERVGSRQEAIDAVLDGLGYLILHSATSAAALQYMPGNDPDATDDGIKAGKEMLAKCREMREEFENLLTGVLL